MSPSTSSAPIRMGRTVARHSVMLLLAVIVLAWAWAGRGIVSSNDGSHLALARALALRGETAIDPDVDLTLNVDLAVRDGRYYSDRPPGTAFLAIPAVWLGNRVDSPLLSRTVARGRVVVRPVGGRYLATYLARSPDGPPLAGLQGTALAVVGQSIAVGLCGLLAVWFLLGRREVAVTSRLVAIACLGLASAWGPYSTMLFSHVTAGAGLIGMVAALEVDRDRPRRRWSIAGGASGAWAVAADYALIVVVISWIVLQAPRRRWRWIALGAFPVALATLAYHDAAFGAPFSVGYDFHANFDFARSRSDTFTGNPLAGAWILLGSGRQAGLLAQSPIMLVGFFGLWRAGERRWLLALAPWLILLSFHHTPWGGSTNDHRYLVPCLPLLSVGIGLLWQRIMVKTSAISSPKRRLLMFTGVVLAVVSCVLVWSHVLSWRG